jgi:hypothetical protein
MSFPAFHDDGAKSLVGGVDLPAGQGAQKDLKDVLDTLSNHPNTAPFIVRRLIQRLVTSNPSPGYIHRVSTVFADNGRGDRGDLGAVVRAILTDYEARAAAVAATMSFGKLKEPLLRATALLRAFDGGSNSGRFRILNAQLSLAQAPLRASTVFNFFEPDYVQPGPLAASGLYAPEYQILTDMTAISIANQLWTYIYANRATVRRDPGDITVGILPDRLLALARTPQALVERVNLILAANSLPREAFERIVAAITAMPAGTSAIISPDDVDRNDVERVRSAVYLVATSGAGAVQK